MAAPSKRDRVARLSNRLGLTALLEALPTRDCLLVLNYHRIGDPEQTDLDPGVFAATADGFREQVRRIRRRLPIVGVEEAVAFVQGRDTGRGTRVLLTFDDGYLDNFEIAFPVLKAEGATAVFFLVTESVGSSNVQWWDQIAWLLGQARRRRFRLETVAVEIDLDRDGLPASRERMLALYKAAGAAKAAQLLAELRDAADAPPLHTQRFFLDWDEAREMVRAGMDIGSHTCSHPVLANLPPDEQLRELTESKAMLEERLGSSVCSLAYPVGIPEAFSAETKTAAREAGYDLAFSFYGGFNPYGGTDPFNVRRHAVSSFDLHRFRFQVAAAGVTGKLWF